MAYRFLAAIEAKAHQVFIEVVEGEGFRAEFPNMTEAARSRYVNRLLAGLTLNDVLELGLLD